MAKATKTCKVCGKKYEYCHTFRIVPFRWQDVACCVEHGNQYFAEIAASRGETPVTKAAEEKDIVEDIPMDKPEEADEENKSQTIFRSKKSHK